MVLPANLSVLLGALREQPGRPAGSLVQKTSKPAPEGLDAQVSAQRFAHS